MTLPIRGARSVSAAEPARVLAVDPPWEHRDTRGTRGAAAKYRTMNTDAICALALPPRETEHTLFLWHLTNMPKDAARVLDAWGYEQLAALDWIKLRPCGTCCATGTVEVHSIGGEVVLVPAVGPGVMRACVRRCPDCRDIEEQAFLGMGTTVRNGHESCLIARPKKAKGAPRTSRDVLSIFAAPMLVDIDGILGMVDRNGAPIRGLNAFVHSAKPDKFFAIVERLYPGPRVEMFSRRTRPGWRSEHSNEADKLDEVARTMREVWPLREREARLAKARR